MSLLLSRRSVDLETWLQRSKTIDDAACVEWLEEGLKWLLNDESSIYRTFEARVDFLLNCLEKNKELGRRVIGHIERALLQLQWVDLFLETSFSRRRTFLSAMWDRLFRPFLPELFESHDARLLFPQLLKNGYPTDVFVTPENRWNEWCRRWQQIKPLDSRLQLHLRKSAFDAITLLSYRIANTLNDDDFRKFHFTADVQHSSFHRLHSQVTAILEDDDSTDLLNEGLNLIRACENELQKVLAHLEQSGVSLDLVYMISLQEVTLRRLRNILTLFVTHRQGDTELVIKFASELLEDQAGARSVRVFLVDQLDLLLRRVVERTGKTGEHYIARNRHEYWEMLRAAAGGGFVTSFTCLIKFVVSHWSLPLFFDGIFMWANFAGSFLTMQFCGFALASKQPATTAPALAAKLKDLRRQNQLFDFVQEVAHLTRSQFIAAMGNVGAVIPTAIGIDLIYLLISNKHIFDLEYSQKTFGSLNPMTSWTFVFAAMTGVLLWSSSLISGAVENWTVYRKISKAIAHNRTLIEILGRPRAEKLATWLEDNIAGIASNLSIGFLLAFFPIFGKFFGIGLEVRHITLSAGSWAFAVCGSFGRLVDNSEIWAAFIGIMGIGILNIGVSFSLALFVAIRARRLRPRWLRALWAAVSTHLRLRPLDFLFPPRKN